MANEKPGISFMSAICTENVNHVEYFHWMLQMSIDINKYRPKQAKVDEHECKTKKKK